MGNSCFVQYFVISHVFLDHFHLLSLSGNIFFLRVTQVFALAELLLLFLTWREIVRSSQKMTKVDNDFVVKAVWALVAFFLLVPVPVEVVGFWMFGTQDSICHDIAM